MFHCTERLLLRPAWPEDWQAIHSGIADEGVVRNLARAPWPYKPDDARDFIEQPIAPFYPRFLITRARDAALVGCIGIDAHAGEVELGYWIARQHWGQGYATEAGRGVLEIAGILGHSRLVASHFLDNPASGRVLAKLGFLPTGMVVKRFSCGRGEEALAAEYAIDLAAREAVIQHAA
ncbi:MAG: GNAT family acetyltransferase [Sphingomonadales bacterium BRH_c3]|nr:MAG: GNAT family acetyltransferase [Sphingomonadales bacterium BRH_c3]